MATIRIGVAVRFDVRRRKEFSRMINCCFAAFQSLRRRGLFDVSRLIGSRILFNDFSRVSGVGGTILLILVIIHWRIDVSLLLSFKGLGDKGLCNEVLSKLNAT